MSDKPVLIEIDSQGRIAADIPDRLGGNNAAKSIPGHTPVYGKKRFYWAYPLNIATCRLFRERFGQELWIGPKLSAWAWDARRTEEAMEDLRAGDAADLPRVRTEAPKLWAALQDRPFQIAGTAFVVKGKRVILGDEPRLGKTYQALAAVVESGAESVLIAAPRTSLRTVWYRKIAELLGETAYVAQGSYSKRYRIIQQFHKATGRKFLIINLEMIRVIRYYDCPDGTYNRIRPGRKGGCALDHPHKTVYEPEYDGLFQTPWDAIILDESHNALASTKNKQSDAISQIRMGAIRLPITPDGLKLAMSGTPFRSKLTMAWGALNWLWPDRFSSFWQYADRHFGVSNTGWRGAKVIGSKLLDEQAWLDEVRPYYLARTKAQVAPQLPPIDYAGTEDANGNRGVYIDMEPAQAKAYKSMERLGLAKLADGSVITANGVLAELTRLKQFAVGQGKLNANGDFVPADPSNKLEWILDFLEERRELTGKVVIATQFTKWAKFIVSALRAEGWETVTITGDSTDRQRTYAQDLFQKGQPRVIVVNMFAGGEAIDLSAADELIMIDEPWTAATIEQMENRIQSLAKRQQLTIYRLRSAGTVDEWIANLTADQRKALLAAKPTAIRKVVDQLTE